MESSESSTTEVTACAEGNEIELQLDNEWPTRLLEMCRSVADRYTSTARPAIGKRAPERVLSFLAGEVLRLLEIHPSRYFTLDFNTTAGTRYTCYLAVHYDDLCRDLTAAADQRFGQVSHSTPPT